MTQDSQQGFSFVVIVVKKIIPLRIVWWEVLAVEIGVL